MKAPAEAWCFVGDETDLRGRTAVSLTVVGEPAVWTGDHLLSNVCTHRGALLVDGECRTRKLRCPYHGRRFGLDGTLLDAPGFESTPRGEDLPTLASYRLGPMTFGAVREDGVFEAAMKEVQPRLGFVDHRALTPDPASARAYEVNAPWWLWCENYLEGFHVPWVHPTLSRALELDRYDVETFEHAALQIGEAAPRDPCFELPSDHPDQGRRIAGYYLFIHPFIALNYYPWGISLNALEPLPDERTRIHYRAYVGREELRDVGAGAGLDAVEHEDDAIVERCARGLASRLYRPGQLHPKHEKAVSWFRKKRDCHPG